MTANENQQAGAHKPTRVLAWLIGFGLLSILFSILLDSPHILPSILKSSDEGLHIAPLMGKIFEHFGVAALIAAIIGLALESESYNSYFLDKLAKTVVKSDYLTKLTDQELKNLQVSLLETFYKLKHLDEEQGFYRYFARLYDYIKSAYREDTRGRITIEYLDHQKSSFRVQETLSYTCRKVGDCIQEHVSWIAAKDEITGIESVSVRVAIPVDVFKSPEFQQAYPELKERGRERIFASADNPAALTRHEDKDTVGYTLSLEEFKGIDGLRIRLTIIYTSPVERGLSWTMPCPSKKVAVVVYYPRGLRIFIDRFGVNLDELSEAHEEGMYTFDYDSWLLPDTGFAFHFLKKQVPDVETVTPSPS